MLAAASKGVSSWLLSSGVDLASGGAFAVSVFLFVILSLCALMAGGCWSGNVRTGML